MVALDTPPAGGLPGTNSAAEPSLNLQHRDWLFHTLPNVRLLKSHLFHYHPVLVTWLSVNRHIFPLKCPIPPLHFIPWCCHLAIFTSQVTEVVITLQTLDAIIGRMKKKELAVKTRGFYSVITKANEELQRDLHTTRSCCHGATWGLRGAMCHLQDLGGKACRLFTKAAEENKKKMSLQQENLNGNYSKPKKQSRWCVQKLLELGNSSSALPGICHQTTPVEPCCHTSFY